MEQIPQWCCEAFAALREFWEKEIAHGAALRLTDTHERSVLGVWALGATPGIVIDDDGSRIAYVTTASPWIVPGRAIVVTSGRGNPDALQLKALNEHIIGSVERAGGTWPITSTSS